MNQEVDIKFLIEAYKERIAELEHEVMIYKALMKQQQFMGNQPVQDTTTE